MGGWKDFVALFLLQIILIQVIENADEGRRKEEPINSVTAVCVWIGIHTFTLLKQLLKNPNSKVRDHSKTTKRRGWMAKLEEIFTAGVRELGQIGLLVILLLVIILRYSVAVDKVLEVGYLEGGPWNESSRLRSSFRLPWAWSAESKEIPYSERERIFFSIFVWTGFCWILNKVMAPKCCTSFGAIIIQLIILLPKYILLVLTIQLRPEISKSFNEVGVSFLMLAVVHLILQVRNEWNAFWEKGKERPLSPGTLLDRLQNLCTTFQVVIPNIVVGPDSKKDGKLVEIRGGNRLVLGSFENSFLTEEEIEAVVAQELAKWTRAKESVLDKLEGYLFFGLPILAFCLVLIDRKLGNTGPYYVGASVLVILIFLCGSDWALNYAQERGELEADKFAAGKGYGPQLESAMRKILAQARFQVPFQALPGWEARADAIQTALEKTE